MVEPIQRIASFQLVRTEKNGNWQKRTKKHRKQDDWLDGEGDQEKVSILSKVN